MRDRRTFIDRILTRPEGTLHRRQFLSGSILAAMALSTGQTRAIGQGQALRIVQVRHAGGWDVHPKAAAEFAEQLRLRTSIDVSPEPMALALNSPQMPQHPFAILSGDRPFELDLEARQRLRRWLELGGFLVVDNAGATRPSSGFDESVRNALTQLFPRAPLERISPEHVLFRSFYRLDYPAGRAIHRPFIEGLPLGSRYGVVVCSNDLMGAMARHSTGGYQFTPTPGGEHQREMAIRFAINLVMYAQCLHYKDDQVHLDYLLRRRKWRIQRPD
jgi:hypothetical protein